MGVTENAQSDHLKHLLPFYVTPLAAEHSLVRSAWQKGDRGSTKDVLLSDKEQNFSHFFDFSFLDAYCEQHGLENGNWWYHSGKYYETPV
jgi:hypothetical protein